MTILRKALGDSNPPLQPPPPKNVEHTQPCPPRGLCSAEGRPDLSKNASLQKDTDRSLQKSSVFFFSLPSGINAAIIHN